MKALIAHKMITCPRENNNFAHKENKIGGLEW